MHAKNTQDFFLDKSIFDKNVVMSAIDVLDKELNPDHVLPDYSPEFRKTLAEGLLYKVSTSDNIKRSLLDVIEIINRDPS